MAVYDYQGNEVFQSEKPSDRFARLIDFRYQRDETTGAFYTVLTVPMTNNAGEKQHPFVIWPNYPNGGTQSTLQMNRVKKYLAAVNGGRYASPYGAGVTLTGLPLGTVIQNSAVLQQGASGNYYPSLDMVLTIDSNGRLGYADPLDSASGLVSSGIVSAVTGFIPVLSGYENIEDVVEGTPAWISYLDREDDSQHQIIGQYENGDYAIITTEGRDYQGGGWFTVRQAQALCRRLGLKDAFMLDGGGSTETVVGQRQLNPFYDNALGRVNPTFIVFNGTTTFGEPE